MSRTDHLLRASPSLGSFAAVGDVIHGSLWLDGCQQPHFIETDGLGRHDTFS